MGWHSLCLPQELEVRWRVSTFHPGGCKQVKPSLPVCMDSFQPESTTGRKAGSASTEASQTERMGSTAWRDHRRTRGQIADPLLSILQTLIGIFRWLPSALFEYNFPQPHSLEPRLFTGTLILITCQTWGTLLQLQLTPSTTRLSWSYTTHYVRSSFHHVTPAQLPSREQPLDVRRLSTCTGDPAAATLAGRADDLVPMSCRLKLSPCSRLLADAAPRKEQRN